SRARIYEMLTALQRTGVSIVLTTHHLEEAEQRCERIVIIDRGVIVASGTVAELVRSSVGAAKRVTIALAAPWPDGPAVPAGAEIDESRRTLTAAVTDVGAELTTLLGRLAAAGVRIVDVKL